MTRGSCLGEKCDNILTLSDFSTLPHLWEVWNYVKNDEGFVRLGEKWAITVTLLDYSLPPQRLHTSEKCGTKQGGEKLWISWSGLDMAIFKSLNSLISRYFPVAKIWKGSMTQTGIRRKRAISRALTIVENPVIPGRIQMEPFIPVEIFHRKKATPLEVLPFSRFYRNDRNFWYHLSG